LILARKKIEWADKMPQKARTPLYQAVVPKGLRGPSPDPRKNLVAKEKRAIEKWMKTHRA
jgi:hypothetical protein